MSSVYTAFLVNSFLCCADDLSLLRKIEQVMRVNTDELRHQGILMRGHLLATLNLWRATLSFSETSDRASERPENVDTRRILAEYIGRPEGSDARSCCQVSDAKGSDIIAAHIFPATQNPKLLTLVNLESTDVNNPRNLLFLAKGIEAAFDRMQVTFTMDSEGTLRLRILDDRLSNVSFRAYKGYNRKKKVFEPITEKSAERFLALEGHPLRYNEDTPPFCRLLAIHASTTPR